MSYVKNVWQNGDVITAEKLNNLEDGADSIFNVQFSFADDGLESDKTYQEIVEAFNNGKKVFGSTSTGIMFYLSMATHVEDSYNITFFAVNAMYIMILSPKDDNLNYTWTPSSLNG